MPDLHDGYARALERVAQMTAEQVKAAFEALVGDEILKVAPQLIDEFGLASADIAAAYYDAAREVAGAKGKYFATPATTATPEQVAASLRWALSGGADVALDRLVGTSQRLALQPGRETIIGSAMRDRVKVGWARHPEPGACGFCLMLASRGAVYASESSASTVGGRAIVAIRPEGHRQGRRGGEKIRLSKQRLGASFHDHCRCTPTPVFEGQEVPEVNRRLQQVWRDNKAGMDDNARRDALVEAFQSWQGSVVSE